jgi:CDP-diacylglycerol--glycerol-3-phosphate 3-phosphatidyltransferase
MILFYAAVLITFLELVEEIMMVALIPRWRTNLKGLYWVLKNKRRKKLKIPETETQA